MDSGIIHHAAEDSHLELGRYGLSGVIFQMLDIQVSDSAVADNKWHAPMMLRAPFTSKETAIFTNLFPTTIILFDTGYIHFLTIRVHL